VARNFLALGLGEAIARLIGFGATVWAIRALGAPTFGVIGVATAALLYFTRITDLGFDLGLGVREIAAEPAFATTGLPTVIAARLLLGTGLAAGLALVGFTLLPEPDGSVLAVYGLTLLATALGTRWVLLGFERGRVAALALTAGQLVMALGVLLLVRGPGDVSRVPAAQLAGEFVAVLCCAWALPPAVRRLAIRWDGALVRALLPRAWSLVASALLGIVVYNAGFLFLRVLHGATAVGYYAAAYTLVAFFLNLGQAYNLSLLPALTRLRRDSGSQLALYHTALAQVFALGLPLALGGAVVADQLVPLLYGSGYLLAAAPFAILIWSVPLNLLRDVPLMALVSAGEERQVFLQTLAAALLNLGLSAALIPRYGLIGAGGATLITEAARVAVALVAARRHGLALPGADRFFRALVAGLLMLGALMLGQRLPLWSVVGLGALVYAVGLWRMGGIRLAPGRLPALTV